ncbi:MAG TPA: hypothetical protein VFU47_07450, partial [Armatimonadota bacterium]|nr:hypothetical protein [Armatimonadota bacterium]
LERAAALAREDGKPHAQLAWVYQQQGRAREAAEQAGRALRLPLPRKWRPWVASIVNSSRKQR